MQLKANQIWPRQSWDSEERAAAVRNQEAENIMRGCLGANGTLNFSVDEGLDEDDFKRIAMSPWWQVSGCEVVKMISLEFTKPNLIRTSRMSSSTLTRRVLGLLLFLRSRGRRAGPSQGCTILRIKRISREAAAPARFFPRRHSSFPTM